MRIPTFDVLFPLAQLRRELRYTLVRIQRRGRAKTWVPLFEALLKEVDAALAQEMKLRDAQEAAEADVDEADYGLDTLALSTAKLARSELSGDALATFLKALYGNEKPSNFVRPKLGDELEQMRTWPSVLTNAPTTALQDLLPRVQAVLKVCDAALKANTEATAALQAFRVSTHAPLVSKVNGERKALGGDAQKQALDPQVGPDSAAGLFRTSERGRPARPETIASLRTDIAEAEAALTHMKERLAQHISQEEADARAEAERQNKAQLIAELERAQADTEAKLQTLRGEVKPRKK